MEEMRRCRLIEAPTQFFDELGATFWETQETRPPSEYSIFEIISALSEKGFSEETNKSSSPLKDQDSYDICEILYDEKEGKELIMDMFLKSIRVFNGEERKITVIKEESNSFLEESVTDMEKTTTASMNVESRMELKKHWKFQSMEVQTLSDMKETKVQGDDFTFIIDDEGVNFVPKNLNQDTHGETLDFFNLFLSPPEDNHAHPIHYTRHKHTQSSSSQEHHSCYTKYEHFQFPNTSCSPEPTSSYCSPNFHDFGYEHECRDNMVRKHNFKAPRSGSFRFTNQRQSKHEITQNLSAPCQFMNCIGNDYQARMVNPAENPSRCNNSCDLCCWYGNNHGLYYEDSTFQSTPQTESSRYSIRRTNHEENTPNLSFEFGSTRGNNVIDMIEASKNVTVTRNDESSKTFKLDSLCASKHQENIPKFDWNWLDAQKDQDDDEFITNFLNTHRDQSPTLRDCRDVTEFNPDFFSTNEVPDDSFQIRKQNDREKCTLILNFRPTADVPRVKQSKLPKGWVRRRTGKGRNFQC